MTRVALLADNVQVIPTLADWYRAEWAPYYGAGGPGDARRDLESRSRRDGMPIGLVAMKGGDVQGTAALGSDEATGLSPSVVGLLVGPGHRGQGIGSLLVEATADLACELGLERIYLSTTVLGDLLERLGWQEYGDIAFLNEEVGKIFACDVSGRRPRRRLLPQ